MFNDRGDLVGRFLLDGKQLFFVIEPSVKFTTSLANRYCIVLTDAGQKVHVLEITLANKQDVTTTTPSAAGLHKQRAHKQRQRKKHVAD